MPRVHNERREERRAAVPPLRARPNGYEVVLALQRTAGNRAVARLLAREPAAQSEAPPQVPQAGPKLNVIAHEGQFLSPGVEGCRAALERVADEKGADAASAWATRFFNMDAVHRAGLEVQYDPALVAG